MVGGGGVRTPAARDSRVLWLLAQRLCCRSDESERTKASPGGWGLPVLGVLGAMGAPGARGARGARGDRYFSRPSKAAATHFSARCATSGVEGFGENMVWLCFERGESPKTPLFSSAHPGRGSSEGLYRPGASSQSRFLSVKGSYTINPENALTPGLAAAPHPTPAAPPPHRAPRPPRGRISE
jgi:hypothetical protein